MVILAEIIIGIISFLAGLFMVLDAYKEYHRKEKYYVGDFWIFVEYLLGFILITVGFIVSTLGANGFYNFIYHILSMEV
jgi:hypothetical protein